MTARTGPRFDLVIFDNDGVLVDSEPHANRILIQLLAEYGLSLSVEECEAEFLGRSLAGTRQTVERKLGRTLPPNFEDRYHGQLFEVFHMCLTAVPGITEALDHIALPRCVASSGTHQRIRLALTKTGLIDRFDGRIFSAHDVDHGKPAPDLFLHAARAMQVDPSRCAVIEDSPIGVEAANAAGMTAFGFARLTPADRLGHASGGIFASMKQLPALLMSRP